MGEGSFAVAGCPLIAGIQRSATSDQELSRRETRSHFHSRTVQLGQPRSGSVGAPVGRTAHGEIAHFWWSQFVHHIWLAEGWVQEDDSTLSQQQYLPPCKIFTLNMVVVAEWVERLPWKVWGSSLAVIKNWGNISFISSLCITSCLLRP